MSIQCPICKRAERHSHSEREFMDYANNAAKRISQLESLLKRYRNETPLGNQPHMIAHQVDEYFAEVGR